MAPKAGSRNNRQLTHKQRAFCEHYVKHWNGTQAVIDAGMTDNRKSANVIASKYLDNKNVNDFIKNYKDKLLNKTVVDGEKVLTRLWEIQEQDGQDRVPAIARIQKQLGLEAVQKTEISFNPEQAEQVFSKFFEIKKI